jgi:hypothetical protein
MACLLAEIRINQERMEAKFGAEVKTIQEKMDSHHEKLVALKKAGKEQITAKMDAWMEGMEACVRKLEANPEKSYALAQHCKVPKEEATVETFRALRKGHRDWHLATRHSDQPEK